jgi:hypothetical protein
LAAGLELSPAATPNASADPAATGVNTRANISCLG